MPQRPLHPLPHFDILMELSGLMVKAEEEKPLVDDLPESPPTIPAERSDLVIKAEDDKASFDDSHESPQTIPAEQADIVVKAEDVAAISDAESIISGVQTDSDMSDMDAPALLSSRGTVAEDFVEAPHHSTPGTQRSLWSPFKLSNTFLVITVVAVVASVGAVYHPTNSLLPRLQSHHLTDLRAGINYATRDTGAQTIPDITSPTRGLSPPSFLLSAFTFVTGYDFEQESIKLPVEALYEELAPGQCWEFSGSRGQLGIILSRTTTVRGLKVSHVDAEDASVRTLWGPRAPKDMENDG
ncbi:hypothetical protein ONZ45_g18386 [Pleurotus djamor]|nr:hypothetical protein ONZ45_g18386 [Pleurotus djamor]